MAESINTGGIRPVTLPNRFPPMPAIARILSRFDRAQLHGFIAVAIDLADALDGDPDEEPNGDDEPVEAEGDTRDVSWTQWETRGRHKMTAYGHEMPSDLAPEYDEEDDASGVHDEDGTNTCFDVFANNGAGCPIADPGGCEHDGREPDDGY